MMPAHVTIHAVRRYAERALKIPVSEDLDDVAAMHDLEDRGIDLEAIRDRLHRACDEAAERGAVGVKFDNVRARLRDGTVTTVMEKCGPARVYGRSLQ